MAKEIEIPKCCNYTDLRKQIPQIEVESIQAFVKGLDEEGLRIMLAEVSDEELITAIHRRMIDRNSKLNRIAGILD